MLRVYWLAASFSPTFLLGLLILFEEEAKSKDGKVLLHCVSGINRSATITMGYLIKYNKMDLTSAFEYVQQRYDFAAMIISAFLTLHCRRQRVAPHSRYVEQLVWLDKEVHGSTVFEEGKIGFGYIQSIRNVKKKPLG